MWSRGFVKTVSHAEFGGVVFFIEIFLVVPDLYLVILKGNKKKITACG